MKQNETKMNKRWWADDATTDTVLTQIIDEKIETAERQFKTHITRNAKEILALLDILYSPSLSPTSLKAKREALEGGGLTVDRLFESLAQAYKEEQAYQREIANLNQKLTRKQDELDYVSVSRLARRSKALVEKEAALQVDLENFKARVKRHEAELVGERLRLKHEAKEFIEQSIQKDRAYALDCKRKYDDGAKFNDGKDKIIKDLTKLIKKLEDKLRKCGCGHVEFNKAA